MIVRKRTKLRMIFAILLAINELAILVNIWHLTAPQMDALEKLIGLVSALLGVVVIRWKVKRVDRKLIVHRVPRNDEHTKHVDKLDSKEIRSRNKSS